MFIFFKCVYNNHSIRFGQMEFEWNTLPPQMRDILLDRFGKNANNMSVISQGLSNTVYGLMKMGLVYKNLSADVIDCIFTG